MLSLSHLKLLEKVSAGPKCWTSLGIKRTVVNAISVDLDEVD